MMSLLHGQWPLASFLNGDVVEDDKEDDDDDDGKEDDKVIHNILETDVGTFVQRWAKEDLRSLFTCAHMRWKDEWTEIQRKKAVHFWKL